MKPTLILYATREGQARRVAEYCARRLRRAGFATELLDARHLPTSFLLNDYGAAVLVASIHAGRHEREMIEFVRCDGCVLDNIPTAFISVSLSEAGAQEPRNSPETRARSHEDARRVMNDFFRQTGWTPTEALPVAGRLAYTKYNPFIRFVLKRIAQRAGGSTDTSRDHEYTDWAAVGRFVDAFVRHLKPAKSVSGFLRHVEGRSS